MGLTINSRVYSKRENSSAYSNKKFIKVNNWAYFPSIATRSRLIDLRKVVLNFFFQKFWPQQLLVYRETSLGVKGYWGNCILRKFKFALRCFTAWWRKSISSYFRILVCDARAIAEETKNKRDIWIWGK